MMPDRPPHFLGCQSSAEARTGADVVQTETLRHTQLHTWSFGPVQLGKDENQCSSSSANVLELLSGTLGSNSNSVFILTKSSTNLPEKLIGSGKKVSQSFNMFPGMSTRIRTFIQGPPTIHTRLWVGVSPPELWSNQQS